MKPLLILMGPAIGLCLVLGQEPETVLRYAGAVLSFAVARDAATCPTCVLKLPF